MTNEPNENKQEDETTVKPELLEALVEVIKNDTSEEMIEIKKMIYKRIAFESTIKPSRIKAPLNITEIGGYFNLMTKLEEKELIRETLISILGLPHKPDFE